MPEKEPKAIPDADLEMAEILPDEPATSSPRSAEEKEAIIRKFFEENKSGHAQGGPDNAKGGGLSGTTDETKEDLLGE